MNELKHTKGNWIPVKKVAGDERTGIIANDFMIALLTNCNNDLEQMEANAKLIAASPGLLEALQAFVDYLDSDLTEGEQILKEQAIAAIQKATT